MTITNRLMTITNRVTINDMFDWIFGEDMDIEYVGEALATGVLDDDDEETVGASFLFDGKGYYDVEGIWHDPDVEDE